LEHDFDDAMFTNENVLTKTKILVACGENYTVAVTKDGQVYSCGNNDYGQLGHEKARKRLREYNTNFQLNVQFKHFLSYKYLYQLC